MENILWIGGAIALAAVVHSVAGFGFALVAIAIVPFYLDLQMAAPLVLLMCLLNNIVLVVCYRDDFDWKAVAPLIVSALVMIPVGLVGLNYLPEQMARRALGIFVVLYVLYDALRLLKPMLLAMPPLTSPRWAYLFGGISGFLTGAFTAGGPALVMYANSKQWSPEEYRGRLPSVYVAALSFALIGHGTSGNLTPELFKIALYTVPLFAAGVGLGFVLSKRIDAAAFRRIVLSLLGVIGMRLIW